MANVVGDIETTLPKDVPAKMKNLVESYRQKEQKSMQDIVDFHFWFEQIHPFQDGNGRVGRLIMFKECLSNNHIPFIIEDDYKFFYYRGLAEYQKIQGYLMDTCLTAQDKYKEIMDYFLSNK